MKLGIAGGVLAVLAVIAAIIGYSALFTVYQTRLALVVRLGQPVRVVTDPGLNFKIPLIDSVTKADKSILDLEDSSQEVIASDQKRLVVDAFARYKINDALKFYQAVGSIEGANSRLSTLLNAALRRVLGEATLTHVVRDERAQLMARVREQLDREADAFNKDPDFFAFYRSMQAYEAGLRHNDTRMVLKPDSDFFRYFADPAGKLREDGRTPAPAPQSAPAPQR